MKRRLKIGLIGIGALLILVFGAIVWFLSVALPIGADFAAKYLCSSTYISQRNPDIAFEEDVAPINPLFKPISWQLNRENKTASADYFGLFTFAGSSYTFATPRDWARFGLLYLQDGVWQGERILPEGWVKYTVTPTPRAPRGEYGALFWLNAGEPPNPANRRLPSAPRDAFEASGGRLWQTITGKRNKGVNYRVSGVKKYE